MRNPTLSDESEPPESGHEVQDPEGQSSRRGLWKHWRSEYTVLGFVVLVLSFLSGAFDLPAKIAALHERIFPGRVELDVVNYPLLQSGFNTNTFCYRYPPAWCGVGWDGLFQLSNLGDEPITITDFSVLWGPSNSDVFLTKLQLREHPPGALVFDDQGDFVDHITAEPGESSMKDWTNFPITIPPRQNRFASIKLEYALMKRGEVVYFADQEALFWNTGFALGLTPDEQGRFPCGIKPVDIVVTTTTGLRLLTVPVAIFLPNCELDMSSLDPYFGD